MRYIQCALLLLGLSPLLNAGDDWAIRPGLTEHVLHYKGQPSAIYRWKDGEIRRPFFYHLHAPDGVQVTRNHPPIRGKDATDHDTMHPGLWMSFGDLNGQDYWRNKTRVWKESEAISKGTPLVLTEHLVLYNREDEEEAYQSNAIQFHSIPEGQLLIWSAQFRAKDKDIVFGDQEEMGLGIRVHTDLTVKAGGAILDSEGRKDEKGIWGKTAKWCAYYRTFDGKKHRGVAILADPANFRPSWWHVRDYGLMVANPFGQKAFTKGEESKITVKKGESMTLRYGVLIFAQEGKAPMITPAYDRFLKMLK